MPGDDFGATKGLGFFLVFPWRKENGWNWGSSSKSHFYLCSSGCILQCLALLSLERTEGRCAVRSDSVLYLIRKMKKTKVQHRSGMGGQIFKWGPLTGRGRNLNVKHAQVEHPWQEKYSNVWYLTVTLQISSQGNCVLLWRNSHFCVGPPHYHYGKKWKTLMYTTVRMLQSTI